MAGSSRGSVATATMTLPSSTVEFGTREALRQVFGLPRTPVEYQCCFGTAWPPKFGRFNIWDLAAGKTAAKLWDATLKDLTMDLLNQITTVGDIDAAVHAWMVGKNADRARPTIVICSTSTDFRVEARRLMKGRAAKYNFGVMTVPTRLSRESGHPVFLDKERSNVLPPLMYGVPITVNQGSRSATIGGEIRLDKERYGVTVAHVFDENDGDVSPDEDIVDLEFDQYSDDEWNDNEASLDELYSTSPTYEKVIHFTGESRLESELKEAYYVLSKHPTIIQKGSSQPIGCLEDPPKMHKIHDWALIKIDTPGIASDNHITRSPKLGSSTRIVTPPPSNPNNAPNKDTNSAIADGFAAGVAAAIFPHESASPSLEVDKQYLDWPAKLKDEPIVAEAFAIGVVAATEFVLVDNKPVSPNKSIADYPEQLATSLRSEPLIHSEICSAEVPILGDDVMAGKAHLKLHRNWAPMSLSAQLPLPGLSLIDIQAKERSDNALSHERKVKDELKSIRDRSEVEDDVHYPALRPDRETRRPIAVPGRYTEDMRDETVWIATGRGALLRGRGIPSACIINIHGQGFVEAFAVSLLDYAIPGDCGSWVVNNSTDQLIGMLIATSRPFGLAYLVPAYQIMADLKEMFPDRMVYLPTEKDLRQLESQYIAYEQAVMNTGHARYTEDDDTVEERRRSKLSPTDKLQHNKDDVEVYIVRSRHGTHNDSIHSTLRLAHGRREDIVQQGDKSAMVTILTMAHGKVISHRDRIMAVHKLASTYQQQGRLKEARIIENQSHVLQSQIFEKHGSSGFGQKKLSVLDSATTESHKSTHTSGFTNMTPSSTTTEMIENQVGSERRGEASINGDKRDATEPVTFDPDNIRRRYTGESIIFDPEAIKRRYTTAAKKDSTRASDAKRDDAQPGSSHQQSVKHKYVTSDRRVVTQPQVPSLKFRDVYDWLLRSVWATEIDITMIGLQNAGKTTLLRVLAGGEFTLDSIPTVGFNMKRIQKGHVTLKCWDLGGQPRFRSMWERFCRGVNSIVFVVDSADIEALPVAKDELHMLLAKPTLAGIPLLVLGNKCDLEEHLSVDELIDALELKAISQREISCYGISAKEETNLDAILQWLIARAK